MMHESLKDLEFGIGTSILFDENDNYIAVASDVQIVVYSL